MTRISIILAHPEARRELLGSALVFVLGAIVFVGLWVASPGEPALRAGLSPTAEPVPVLSADAASIPFVSGETK